MIDLSIPIDFIASMASLSWRDVAWAYRSGFLTWRDVQKYADEQVKSGVVNPLVAELPSIGKENLWRLSELLDTLAARDVGAIEATKEKWLFICLEWVYQNRNKYKNPLTLVEEIYADFDYPSEIESFVSYMPPLDGYDPSQFSHEENVRRLMQKWGEYLTTARGKWQ